MRNTEVSQFLETIADLLEIKGEDFFRVRSYREAARQIENLMGDIAAMRTEGRLREAPGVGPTIAARIDEYITTGRSQYLDKLREEIPESLTQLLGVPGIGPRKAYTFYKELGITDLTSLESAAREHRLYRIAGVGEKTEERILRELQRLKQRTKRTLLGTAIPIAEELAALLRRHPDVVQASAAGSVRRLRDTVGDIDILAASARSAKVMADFMHAPQIREMLAQGEAKASVLVAGNLQVDLLVVPPESWGSALQHFTGSQSHNVRLRELAQSRGLKLNEYGVFEETSGRRLGGEREEDVYQLLDLPYIVPELREDRGEIEAAQEGRLPDLINLPDVCGDLHIHTDWSDGMDPLETMAEAAKARGYQYVAITDHSQSLAIARGLSPERVREQRQRIQELNERLKPFRVLQGTEMDIRSDGTLDYPDEVLREFDVVSASIHSGLNQPKEKITQRLIAAMCNPYVDVVNHPTSRLLGRREAYEVDLEAVLRVAAETGVALEINASPERLDLDDVWARRAIQMGIPLTVSTDAHSTVHLGFMTFGVGTARRGWVERHHVINCSPLDDFLTRLRRRRAL